MDVCRGSLFVDFSQLPGCPAQNLTQSHGWKHKLRTIGQRNDQDDGRDDQQVPISAQKISGDGHDGQNVRL